MKSQRHFCNVVLFVFQHFTRQKGLKIRTIGFDIYYHFADFTLWIQKPECL